MKSNSRFFLIISIVLIIALCMFVFVSCNKDKKDDEPVKTNYLTNQNATAEAQSLYNFIRETYTHKIISGQEESTWISEDYEFDYIYEHTGKYPAIRGSDFIDDDFAGVVTRAKKWHQKGGIVSICWHCSPSFDRGYEASQNEKLTDAQWEAMLTKGTPENAAMLAGMKKAGDALKELQDANIPVLWRPFHEFDGGWFWWGRGDNPALLGEHFKKLWIAMYDYYTNELKLNNLIWVLGYSYMCDVTGAEDFYPGDEYCDIVGADSYAVETYGAEKRIYEPMYEITKGKKPLAFHETGLIPSLDDDPDNEDMPGFKSVPWVWFMTWHTEWLIDKNTVASLNTLYNSDYVLTLDEIQNR